MKRAEHSPFDSVPSLTDTQKEARPIDTLRDDLFSFLEITDEPNKSERPLRREARVYEKNRIEALTDSIRPATEDPEWKGVNRGLIRETAEALKIYDQARTDTGDPKYIRVIIGGKGELALEASHKLICHPAEQAINTLYASGNLRITGSGNPEFDMTQIEKLFHRLFALPSLSLRQKIKKMPGVTSGGTPVSYNTSELSADIGTLEDVREFAKAANVIDAIQKSIFEALELRMRELTVVDESLKYETLEYEGGYFFEFVERELLKAIEKHAKDEPNDIRDLQDYTMRVERDRITPIIRVKATERFLNHEFESYREVSLPPIDLKTSLDIFLHSILIENNAHNKRKFSLPKDCAIPFSFNFYAWHDEPGYYNARKSGNLIFSVAERVRKLNPTEDRKRKEPEISVVKNEAYYLNLLGISASEFRLLAANEQNKLVKMRHRELVKDFHPDKFVRENNPDSKRAAESMMRDLNGAREFFLKRTR
ncbi:MAG: hypothetical protein AAB886_01165 [Patescibacteria group bacterium]